MSRKRKQSLLPKAPPVPPLFDERMTEEYQEVIPPELEGWTKNEKYDLNLALKHVGFDIPKIQARIPTKTAPQIRTAIDYFIDELNKKDAIPGLPRKRISKPPPQVPLAKWADLMTDTIEYKDLQTDCATALRIIANFEKFPRPTQSSKIDFQKMYLYMADAMEGKPLPDDPIAAQVFNYCIMETSEMSKAYMPKTELKEMLKLLSTGEGSVNIPLPTRDGGLAALRSLMSQRNYNPMRVPEHYLKYPPKYTSEIHK